MIDLEQAKIDPARVFKRPSDVLHEKTLTREQKIDILQRWEYDERAISVAEEENMHGTNNNRHTHLLEDILKALQHLHAADHQSTSTKHG